MCSELPLPLQGCDRDGLWHRSDLRLSHQPGMHSRHDERRPSSGAGSPWLHHRTVAWRGRGRSRALRDPVEQARGLRSRGVRPRPEQLGEGYLGGYGLLGALVTEFVATFIFVYVILAATNPTVNLQVAGLIIGLTLFALHFPFINVTGLSVNPARSLGPAVLVGGKALAQVWLFLIVPSVAGACAGLLFREAGAEPDGSGSRLTASQSRQPRGAVAHRRDRPKSETLITFRRMKR